MVPSLKWLGLAVVFAAVVAGVSCRLKLLSLSGALAAFILGFLVFGFGGISWTVVLLTFFVSSSGLSKILKKRNERLEEKYAKGSRRDAGQVLANGGFAGFLVIIHIMYPDSSLPWIGYCASFAAANADTWATELGVLSKNSPRLLSTWKLVPMGTSGGVTKIGTMAAVAGALLIAAVSLLFLESSFLSAGLYLLVILAAGVLGSLVDSLLGATVQAVYWCPVCGKETEQSPRHRCGSTTEMLRGWKWLNNDWVNTFCTVSAAGVSILLGSLI